MCRSRLIATIVAASLILGSRGVAGDLVEGSDARAKPIKQALAVLVKSIDSGDVEKARSAYAGTGADADLLKAYVEDVAAAKALRAAMAAKFGDHFRSPPRGFDSDVARMAVYDFNSVIFLDDSDRASSSADSPLGVGIEFKRVRDLESAVAGISAGDR